MAKSFGLLLLTVHKNDINDNCFMALFVGLSGSDATTNDQILKSCLPCVPAVAFCFSCCLGLSLLFTVHAIFASLLVVGMAINSVVIAYM